MLRLPPQAATIRCPKCKTMLEIAEEELPFVEVEVLPDAKPQIAKPAAAPAKPATRKNVLRPALVDERAEAEEAAERQRSKEAERKREIRRELQKMDDAKADEDDEYEEVKRLCRHGRNSLMLLTYGLYAYGGGILLVFLGVMPAFLFGFVVLPAILLGYVAAGLGTLLLMGGFGAAFLGPREGFFVAGAGLGASVLQIAFTMVGLIALVAGIIEKLGNGATGFDGYNSQTELYFVLGFCSNFFLLADAPARFVSGNFEFLPFFALAAAVFEFARFAFITMLVQRYGELAKYDRTASQAASVTMKIFWMLLLTAMFRIAVTFTFDWIPSRDPAWWIGQAIHLLLLLIMLGVLGFQLVRLGQIAQETSELLYADRVASKFDNVDAV